MRSRFFSIIEQRYNEQNSSGSSGQVREEERKMKSMGPLLIAIFFITYFYRVGGHDPSAPPGSATVNNKINAQVPGQGHTKFKVAPIHTVVIEVIS